MNFHQVQRATVDLDLIVHLERKNVLAFVEMVSHLGFKPRLPVDAKDFADAHKRKEWIEEKGMMVFSFIHPGNPFEVIDVFSQEPKPFQELAGRQLLVDAFGIKIRVIGKMDLIEMKDRAGRDKDLFDAAELRKLTGQESA
ncbi:MAG TPA: hypothetical protein VI895_01535 [Bdellovibrionota bacterium]|nr:hypothetical protein [Bdellovibrionota bacterium]